MAESKSQDNHSRGFIKSKADFTQAYRAYSPAELMEIYTKLDYKVPYHIEHFIAGILNNFSTSYGIDCPVIADIGCAHGYSGLILKHGIAYDEIRARVRRHADDDAALVAALKCDHPGNTRATFIGSDVAEAAITFCRDIHVHELSFCCDLEHEHAPEDARKLLARANLVLSSGVYGYISELTMGRLQRYLADPQATWFCNFVLRPLDYGPTARLLAERGYRTVRAPVAFPHRRFETPVERDQTLQFLRDADLDPTPEKTTGYLHTCLYISFPQAMRPAETLDRFWAREIPRHKASRLFAIQ